MSEVMLSLQQLNKIYGGTVHAVKDFDMTVNRGEIVALLGSSGCGKTSTLRMIAGFEEVTSGSVQIAGREVHTLPPAQRNVAMAFEGYSLYPPLTVAENIGFALRSAGLSRSEVDERVGQMAKLLDVESILDRYPTSISGGQQQRASLGRALIREADLYLLDEPMGQLEPQLRAVLRGRIKHFLKERNLTTILVTHDQTEANALADRIAVMEDGVLQQFATPQALKDSPANLFTGSFIGEPPMNVFTVGTEGIDDGIRFSFGEGVAIDYTQGDFSEPVRDAILSRNRIVLGIRPHAVRQAEAGVPARVTANQWLGDQTHIAANLAGTPLVAVEHERLPIRMGDEIRVALSAKDLHLFDAESGKAFSHGGALA